MDSIITIYLPKQQKERLNRLALIFGLSLSEFSRKVLSEIEAAIPTESFSDYINPKELKNSLTQAMRDWRTGRTNTKL